MKIAIICAMQEELDSIADALNFKSSQGGMNNSYFAKYGRHELTFNLCGIGKVNSAMNTQKIISTDKIDFVINVGIAGNLSDTLNFGDVVIATDLVHHDMDVTGFGIQLGQVPRMDVFAFPSAINLLNLDQKLESPDFQIVYGRIASGDQFINDKEKASFIYKEFNAIACEMEGASIAHVCHVNNIPFLVIRSMSDKAGLGDIDAIHSYQELTDMASARASFVVKEVLSRI